MGRITEYIDYINRTDIGISRNPKELDYKHLTMTMKTKRDRYLYQKKLRGEEPVK